MANTIDALLDLQTLARALGGEINGGQVLAPGPGHSPKDRSLSVKLDSNAPDGFVVHSFATDDPITCRDHVRDKLGLPAFKANGANGGGRRRASDDAVERALMAAVSTQFHNDKPKGTIVATYDYTDSNGALLYQVLRLEPKDFRQRRPDGNGGWSWKLDARRVVYRWPELLKYPDGTIFICEGERDANNVAALGHCATCVAGGKWTTECVAALAGRDCIILEDNDAAGREKARAAAQALHGTAKTIRIVSLPGLPDKGDVSDWLDADPRRANKFVAVCFDAPLWTPGDNIIASKTETPATESKSETPALPFIDMSRWDDEPAPAREWAVPDRIPLRQPTLFSGEGDAGKTLIALQLCAAHALGRDWLRTLPTPGPAIYFGAEDDTDELHRRLTVIAAHYNASFADLIAGGLHLLCYAGEDALLGVANRNGLIEATPLFARLKAAASTIQPKLIVIDTAADVFSGSENDRMQVRGFVGLLRRLAIAGNSGVLLCSHPSLTGISSGSGLSGSTGWHNSVRARMYLHAAVTDDGDTPDPELRQIEFLKNNYGPLAERILLRWKAGVFVPEPGASSLERIAAEAKVDSLFLDLLARFNKQERNVNDKAGPTYAPAVFAQEAEAKAVKAKKPALADAMRRLFASNRIHLETYGKQSRPFKRLAVGGC